MVVEYISRNLSCIRWNSSETSNNSYDNSYIVGCTYLEKPFNELKVYNVFKKDDISLEIFNSATAKLDSTGKKIAFLNKSMLVCCKDNGSASLFSIEETSLGHKINKIDEFSELSSYAITDIVVDNARKSLTLSSEDGKIIFIDINNNSQKKILTKHVSESAITCITPLNTNEYIFGNEIGSLKIYDIRKGEINLSLAQNLSCINCVSTHKGNNHIVACGNDSGHLRIIDLRNSSKDLQLIAAHEGPITDLKYKLSEPNTIITSSLDGELLKWSFTVDNNLVDVFSVYRSNRSSSILSFDINSNDWLAFSTDLESIYCSEM